MDPPANDLLHPLTEVRELHVLVLRQEVGDLIRGERRRARERVRDLCAWKIVGRRDVHRLRAGRRVVPKIEPHAEHGRPEVGRHLEVHAVARMDVVERLGRGTEPDGQDQRAVQHRHRHRPVGVEHTVAGRHPSVLHRDGRPPIPRGRGVDVGEDDRAVGLLAAREGANDRPREVLPRFDRGGAEVVRAVRIRREVEHPRVIARDPADRVARPRVVAVEIREGHARRLGPCARGVEAGELPARRRVDDRERGFTGAGLARCYAIGPQVRRGVDGRARQGQTHRRRRRDSDDDRAHATSERASPRRHVVPSAAAQASLSTG